MPRQIRALVPASSTNALSTHNQFQCFSDPPAQSYQEALTAPKTPAKQQSTRDTPFYHYFIKPHPTTVLYLTPETEPLSHTQLEPFTQKLFPKDFQWFPTDLKRTREFYERILEDSGSAEFTHRLCETDPSKINFSKIKILKVLKIGDWSDPWELRPFTVPHNFPGYTYEDYKNAWTNALLLRPNHSWFIYFDRKCNDDLPIWFYHWWHCFGATLDIYPGPAKAAFDYYLRHSPDKMFTRSLRFHRDLAIAWIVCWTFETIQIVPKPYPLSLCRKYKIRW